MKSFMLFYLLLKKKFHGGDDDPFCFRRYCDLKMLFNSSLLRKSSSLLQLGRRLVYQVNLPVLFWTHFSRPASFPACERARRRPWLERNADNMMTKMETMEELPSATVRNEKGIALAIAFRKQLPTLRSTEKYSPAK